MSSRTPIPEFITVPKPPRPSLRRRGSVFLGYAACGALLNAAAHVAVLSVFPACPAGTPCFLESLISDRVNGFRTCVIAAEAVPVYPGTSCPPEVLTPEQLANIRTRAREDIAIADTLTGEPNVRERLRTIIALGQAEAAIRAGLPRSQPGLVVPSNGEVYR